MSDETKREEIKEETHELEDTKQDELEEDETTMRGMKLIRIHTTKTIVSCIYTMQHSD
ncbi:MAG: hypothetical protein ACJ71G_20030 [Nitrososphaeraceae archaeon]